MSRQIVTSIFDTDTYKLTMQQAVLQLFPESVVTYRFKNRGGQRFNANFLQKLQEQLQLMSQIQLSQLEYSWIKTNIPFFKSWYIEYLRNYRFNPDEVNTSLSEDNDLIIDIQGTWASTILWEVPLMAIISELYFMEIETKWSDTPYKEVSKSIKNKAALKSIKLGNNKCYFADFGTRRRRSYYIQKIVLKAFSKHNSYYVGTSNVHFAMKLGMKPIGTAAHEWVMGNSILEGLRNANYYAWHNWRRVYDANLGIALTDTFGTNSFLKNFTRELSKVYDGVRHDSGDPFRFTDKIVKHYKGFQIDPLSKTIVFSDGLNVNISIKINEYCAAKIKCSFGIGTHFTNDFIDSPALNMVIKLWSCNGVPVVKLSDTPGKVMGDPDAVRVAQWTHQRKSL